MNAETEAEAAQFPEKEYTNGIFVAVQCSLFPITENKPVWPTLKWRSFLLGLHFKLISILIMFDTNWQHWPLPICSICTIGGFNVSNLMGIKRRMMDIGKKITFYFLQNDCLKMYSFFRICIKCMQKVLLWPKNFFIETYQYGYQKTQNFMLISNSLMPA